ncbi:MAG TPA: hypothetical protein VFY95_06320 [Sphingomicrobium sp.]
MLVGLLLFAAAPAAQPNPAPATGQAPTAKVECRMVQEPGSRIPTRICRLDKEWEALAKDAQDDLRSSRNSRGVAVNPSE